MKTTSDTNKEILSCVDPNMTDSNENEIMAGFQWSATSVLQGRKSATLHSTKLVVTPSKQPVFRGKSAAIVHPTCSKNDQLL
ncbi:hypothetical protein [Paraherbaspirillum soli]|uniref:Uncharacterized protein n=1 Tax=Paraherbaspirillum soli TaxID=631222 RepID=A0ABW0M6M2_9BURK